MISYVIRDTASVSPCPAARPAVQHVTEERSWGTIGGCKAVRHGLRTGGEPGKWEAPLSSLLSPAPPPDVAVADGYASAGAADGRDGGKSMPTTDG